MNREAILRKIDEELTEHSKDYRAGFYAGYAFGVGYVGKDSVVHAHWKWQHRCHVCSNCTAGIPVDYKYCPACGAKMDEEEP